MGYKPDIYPLKPTPPSGLGSAVSANTTKPLAQAHNFQLRIGEALTLMTCSHCGETYRLFSYTDGNVYWEKLTFVDINIKQINPPGACALPDATQ